VGEDRLVEHGHVVGIDVVLEVAEDGRQLPEQHRVVVLGFVGRELDLVHEGVGVGQEVSDADQVVLLVFFVEDARCGRLLLLKFLVPAHSTFSSTQINYNPTIKFYY
jgi:hypothetical protein